MQTRIISGAVCLLLVGTACLHEVSGEDTVVTPLPQDASALSVEVDDFRFGVAGPHPSLLSDFAWYYHWNNSYLQDQGAAAPNHRFAWVVGKLDHRPYIVTGREVSNRSFDNGLTGWSFVTSGGGERHVGNYYGRTAVAAIRHAHGGWGSQVMQVPEWAMKAGDTYCATAMVHVPNGSAQVLLQQGNAGPNQYRDLGRSTVSKTSGWRPVTACGRAFADTTRVQIVLRTLTPGTWAYFDEAGSNPQYHQGIINGAWCSEDGPACARVLLDFETPFIRERLAKNVNRAGVWIVGNEGDWSPRLISSDQYNNGRAYGEQYRRYRTLLRGLDPSARIANTGFAWPVGVLSDGFMSGFTSVVPASERPDIWNVHLYPRSGPRDWQSDLSELQAFRAWMDSTGEGHKPLWVTEFGVLHANTPQSDVDYYMDNILREFASKGLVQRWFWFVGNCGAHFATTNFPVTTCLNYGGQGTDTGDRYLYHALDMDRVQNASFERWHDNWRLQSSGSGAVTQSGEAFEGWSAARIQHNTGSWGTQVAQNVGAFAAGQRVRVSAWLKSSNGAAFEIALQRLDTYAHVAGSQGISGSAWRRVYFEATVSAAGELQVFCRNRTQGGVLYCDDIHVTPL